MQEPFAMTRDPQSTTPLFTHIDVSSHPANERKSDAHPHDAVVVSLLRELIKAQDRQNELLEEMLQQMNTAQRQRANELGQWKQANPYLARQCREAAESLSNVQTNFLRSLTEEISEHAEDLMDGEFMLNEFVDRYGPRLAHLNGVLQVLSQLSSNAAANESSG
jgi:predicted DsbA family dithiol-disulfide isomerase